MPGKFEFEGRTIMFENGKTWSVPLRSGKTFFATDDPSGISGHEIRIGFRDPSTHEEESRYYSLKDRWYHEFDECTYRSSTGYVTIRNVRLWRSTEDRNLYSYSPSELDPRNE